jgi:hypothetical protein
MQQVSPALFKKLVDGERACALILGIIFLVVGIAGFIHNAVHLVVGILGIAAATSFSGALVYNQGFAVTYAAIAVMGILPLTNTTFGLMPIYGNNVWFNALAAIAAAYFGFVKPAELAKMETSGT